MPYKVEKWDLIDEQLLNSLESQGWTLAHVVSGYAWVENQPGQVNVKHMASTLIFHKPGQSDPEPTPSTEW